MKKILKLIGINVVVLLVLGEIMLRVIGGRFSGQVGLAMRYVTTGQPYSQEWTPAWQQNREHYWALRPNLDNVLQYGSPSVSFNLSTVELWEGAGIGFRTSPIDFFVDTVVIGDSFGMCFTEQSDCWVDQLQTLSGKNIVNLSQPVTGTTSHYRILRDFGQPLEPALVIWQFFGNDFNDDYGLAVFNNTSTALDDPETVTTDAGIGGFLRRNVAVYAFVETLLQGYYLGMPASESLYVKPYRVQYGENNQNTLMFGGRYELEALDMSLEKNQQGLIYSQDSFKEAQDLVTSWNGRLVVVLIPTREEVYSSITAPIMGQEAIDKLASARLTMLELCEMKNLQCLDPIEEFRQYAENGEALYFSDDMHLNPLGNRILAEWLNTRLFSN
jgi:hypothetical protein